MINNNTKKNNTIILTKNVDFQISTNFAILITSTCFSECYSSGHCGAVFIHCDCINVEYTSFYSCCTSGKSVQVGFFSTLPSSTDTAITEEPTGVSLSRSNINQNTNSVRNRNPKHDTLFLGTMGILDLFGVHISKVPASQSFVGGIDIYSTASNRMIKNIFFSEIECKNLLFVLDLNSANHDTSILQSFFINNTISLAILCSIMSDSSYCYIYNSVFLSTPLYIRDSESKTMYQFINCQFDQSPSSNGQMSFYSCKTTNTYSVDYSTFMVGVRCLYN